MPEQHDLLHRSSSGELIGKSKLSGRRISGDIS